MTLTHLLFLGIVVILAAARLLGAAAVRLGRPRVTGEITAGLVLGPALPGRLAGDAVLPAESMPGEGSGDGKAVEDRTEGANAP
ncbi:hypothetical protein ACFYXC_05245 [Streptomyces sp. NPDC002701]|uniref:hypothetical protein n=1 Tax=unclassified Streptomyces TaxID=2593676 RepID=UPI0036D18470